MFRARATPCGGLEKDESFEQPNMDTDTTGLNSNEKKIIRTQHWRSIEEILYSSETIFPRNLIVELLLVS